MKHLRHLVGAASMLIVAVLCGPLAAQGIVLKAADTHADGYPTVEAVEHVGELLSNWTNGRIQVKMFAGRQLGEEKDTIEQTIAGAIELNRVNLAPLNGIIPETAIPALPYIFRSIDHMHKVMDGEIGAEILAAMEKHGMVGLAFYDSGARSFYNSQRPINSPADMKGMKIRVQNSDLFVATMEALGANATPIPETAIPALPYIFRSIDHMHKVMDGEIGAEILASMEKHGLVGLAFYDSGARSFYNSQRPINSPADMKGMKIRVQNSDLFVATMEALGANATPMEFGQVYEALKTGVIDGAENNWPSYESTRHFEVANHYTLDQHSLSPEVLVISKIAWDKLSATDKQLVRKAAALSVPVMRELWNARVVSSKEKVIANGNMVIDSVDKQPFIDAMKPVYERFAGTDALQALVTRIQDVE